MLGVCGSEYISILSLISPFGIDYCSHLNGNGYQWIFGNYLLCWLCGVLPNWAKDMNPFRE